MIEYFKKSFVTYVNLLLRLVLLAGSNVIIANYLGPSGKGILSLIMSFLAIILMIGMSGVDEANVYFMSSGKAPHRKIITNALFHTFFISCICIFICIVFMKWFITNPLKGIDIKYFYIIIMLIPFYFINQHFRSILLGHRAIYKYNILIIAQFIVLFLIQLIFIPKTGLFGGILAIIVSTFTLTLLGSILLLKYELPGISIDFSLMKKSYFFGMKSQLGIIFSFLNQRLDFFVVNFFLNPSQVGIYAIAVVVAELPWHLPAAAATVLFPWIADKNKDEAAKFTAYILRNILFFTTIMIIVLALFGKYIIITLFGAAFQGSIVLMYVLLPGILALSITRILGSHFQGSGRPELGTIMVAFSFIETIVLDIILIPRFGTLGAAIASSIAYMTSAIVGLFIFIRIWHINIFEIVIPRWQEIIKIRKFIQILKRSKNK